MKLFGIEFAPLIIPFTRRLQTLAVVCYVFLFMQGLSIIGYSLLAYLLFYTRFYWLTLLYAIWYYYDYEKCHQGSRRIDFIRQARIWTYLRDYFPIRLIKTCDLDATNKNYLIGLHPHGIMSFASFINFCTDATHFSKLFPGITPHLLTLEGQFKSPFSRELFMTSGACAASERSMKWILTNKGNCQAKGQMCGLIVGGAAEALEAHPNTQRLVLAKRRGFIRIALQTGASLVPAYSFGETDVYYTYLYPENTRLRRLQLFLLRLLGVGLPLLAGRGIFNYQFGILPYRHPIYTVIGAPIHLDKPVENPSAEQIDALHERYVHALKSLFDEHKHKFLKKEDYDHKKISLDIVK